jgi:imidazolonepropionase-like amidohydrolase
MAAGNRSGIAIDEAMAIRWITLNPAKALGIADKTGSLEAGKAADVVIWDGNPFSVYSHAAVVYVDGALVYDRNDPEKQAKSDFSLGILEVEGMIE